MSAGGCSPPGPPSGPTPWASPAWSCSRWSGTPPDGPALVIGGADLLDGTPVFDIKPYVPLSDCRPQAAGGFSDAHREDHLLVEFPLELEEKVPREKRRALRGVLAGDPRPSYQRDPGRV